MSSLLLTIAASAATAADTGAKFAGSLETPNGQWADASNALGSGTGDFMISNTAGEKQGFGTFGLGVPNGSIIDGISVSVSALSTDDAGCRIQVQLSGAGGSNLTNAKNGNLSSTQQTLTFGGAADTWGRVWDPTQTTNGNFRVVVTNDDPGSACDNGSTTSVDTVSVQVTYRTIDQHQVDNAPLTSEVCDQADFNFVIDMSGSIGEQDGAPSNLPQIKDGISAFVNAFQAGGDGVYSGTTFNGTSADELTSGYVSAATFLGDVDGLSGPSGTTPTAAGISTGAANDAGNRAGVPNIMFVLTDGSPNVPGGNLSDPPTWLQAADAAIGAADDARTGHYIVKAVYLSTDNDPGDTTLPFSNPAGDAAWATAVMTQIGGGSFLPADFTSFVDDLFKAIHCTPPSETSISTSASDDVTTGGDIHDTATLTGGTDQAGGTIRFDLYGPNDADCASSIYDHTVDVFGNGDYDSGTFTTAAAGTYRWVASYSGDDNNQPAAGACGDKGESVVVTDPLVPNIDVTKLVATGDSAFGPTSVADPGDTLTFQITVHNSGTGAATGVDVSDDISAAVAHGTYDADCSPACGVAGNVLSWDDLTIAAGGDAVLSYSVTLNGEADFPIGVTHLPNTVVVVGPGSNCPPAETVAAAAVDPDCSTDTTVTITDQRAPTILAIVKSNDAPPVSTELPGGGSADLPTAPEGSTVHYTLAYDFDGDPATGGVLTDVLPAGIEYVAGSASTDSQFTDVSYDAGTRTLRWITDGAEITAPGTLTYSAVVQTGASKLAQPLTNTATIRSDQTAPDSDSSDVYVPTVPGGETHQPTPPPTDALADGGTTSSGAGLLLLLGVLGTIIVGVSYLTPARFSTRRKSGR